LSWCRRLFISSFPLFSIFRGFPSISLIHI
jgi:hypothetical protein